VFDAGANVGNWAQAYLDAGARVVAIEHNPECVKTLRQRFGRKITVVPYGIGKKRGRKTLFIDASNSEASTCSVAMKGRAGKHDKVNYTKAQKIGIVTLDWLAKKYGQPDIIKLDIEGSESEALQSLSKPSRLISFEYHSIMHGEGAASLCLLEKISYRKFNLIMHRGYDELEFPVWVDSGRIRRFLEREKARGRFTCDIFATTA
jgi:FkbM family methyltransferase